jgi:hypothetical protein
MQINARRGGTRFTLSTMPACPRIPPMRLFFLLYSLVATVLSGTGLVIVLVAGLPGWQPIVVAAAIGAMTAVAVSWIAARKIEAL